MALEPATPETAHLVVGVDAIGTLIADTRCLTYWGSHGCDKTYGHDGPHQCGGDDPNADADSSDSPCSRFYGNAGEEGEIRSAVFDSDDRFVEWADPWTARAFS